MSSNGRFGCTTGAALAAAGLMAFAPTVTPVPPAPLIRLLADDMVLDLVRHGESADNVAGILGTTAPGADLTDLGRQQAATIAEVLKDLPGLHEVFASELVRTQQTAAPLLDALGPGAALTVLPGLDEIDAGLVDGLPAIPFAPLYILPPVAWALGFPLVPMLGSPDVNGFVFSDRFGAAVDTIYGAGAEGATDDFSQVAFSHSAAIMFWTQMNVTNPDPTLLLTHQLSNTGVVEITGNPADGWTLLSWDGVDVAPDPGLWQSLFVDTRDLLVAPQAALWELWQALPGADVAAILAALQSGLTDTLHTTLGFPLAILDDVATGLHALGAEVAAALPADLAALLTGILTAI